MNYCIFAIASKLVNSRSLSQIKERINTVKLKPLCVESYVAIPFFDSSGTVLGLLGIMDGNPLENVQLTECLLTIFADRIATELERETLLLNLNRGC